MSIFSGQVAWVTGGGRGIGLATSLKLAKLGASVCASSRQGIEKDQLPEELHTEVSKICSLVCDVSDWEAVRQTVAQIESSLGPIDILINNAAILDPLGSTWQTNPQEWAHTIQVNLIGAYHCIRASLPGMIERGKGTILNVSSGAAHSATTNWSAYASSKAGLDHFTRSLAQELKGTGVRVNAIYPGIIETSMVRKLLNATPDQLPAHRRKFFENALTEGKVWPPAVAAQVMVWMVSDQANDLCGAVLDLANNPDLIEEASEAIEGT